MSRPFPSHFFERANRAQSSKFQRARQRNSGPGILYCSLFPNSGILQWLLCKKNSSQSFSLHIPFRSNNFNYKTIVVIMGFLEGEGKKVKEKREALRLLMAVSSIQHSENDVKKRALQQLFFTNFSALLKSDGASSCHGNMKATKKFGELVSRFADYPHQKVSSRLMAAKKLFSLKSRFTKSFLCMTCYPWCML